MWMRNHWRCLAVTMLAVLVCCGLLLWLLQAVESNRRKWREYRAETENRCWSDQIQRVATGKRDSICLAYGSRDVDKKLREIERLAGLRALTLEGSDVTGRGLASIAAMPSLRELSLYGGTRLDNRDFEALRGNASLKRLLIVYRDAHQEPLPVLTTLPNLEELTIFDRQPRVEVPPAGERPIEPAPTAEAWYWLGELRQLKRLNIGGAGVSDECVSHLRRALPRTLIQRLGEEPSMR